MEARELRIGNWINDRVGRLCQVEALEKDKITAYAGGLTGLPYKPIPLTEEWLDKFGFKKELKHFFTLYTMKFEGLELEFEFKKGDRKANYVGLECIGIDLEHVHQLQNLYFALTGKELELDGKLQTR